MCVCVWGGVDAWVGGCFCVCFGHFYIGHIPCPFWLSGELKATCVCSITDFYNIKTPQVHKGSSAVMTKASIAVMVLCNYSQKHARAYTHICI
jgi:hypothetical protein